ncbi:MAG: DedA family protein/thiosulfate sulfurtransferase GlpE [Casimicrobiaceae bacterium]
MPNLVDLLRDYGLGFVFLNVLLEQGGLPIPAVPTMMVAGAVAAATGESLARLALVAVLAAVVSDTIWYFAGRRIGMRVLRLLCRISLSPDSCVRQTESIFGRFGAASLLLAKFIPGFASVSTALAGAVHIRYWKFLLFDTLGAALWVGIAVGLGYLFRNALNDVLDVLDALGRWGTLMLLIALAGYIAMKWWQRRAFVRQLRMDRVSVDELRALMDASRVGAILDVRTSLSQDATGRIPGARVVDLQSLDGLGDVARDGEVIVYCACPNEASAVTVARRLRQLGFMRVRPLHGGIDAWIAAGFEVAH